MFDINKVDKAIEHIADSICDFKEHDEYDVSAQSEKSNCSGKVNQIQNSYR